MRCIAVINQKGGCGKTTISINLSASLASMGERTLLIDMDPQNHCAVGLAVPEEQIENNIYDVLISSHTDVPKPLKSIIWQISQNFDLAPSGIELAALEPQLAGKDRREESLRRVLEPIADIYRYVIIDCPPSVGLLTFNALRAADEVIIPVETGYFALHSLSRQMETLNVLMQQCQQSISFRILASMYDVRTKLAREVLSELRKHYHDDMFETVINFNTKLKEAASFGQPITEYDPSSKGMRDFMALAREVIQASAPAEKMEEETESIESQLRAISKTANEILEESQQLIADKATTSQNNSNPTTEEKIENIYGVRQKEGKIEFVALYPNAETVKLAGDFNQWQPENTPLICKDKKGIWHVELPLPEGRYQYRYVVDGRWQSDPYNENVQTNEFGEYNSVLEVH